ncbi:MAG: excinuclease ABC subunit UvrA [Phytoplasma sp.]|uniref:excinuclease ABC subunit UvrA n=1 Tax=Phytoplasma sp. TaxID=2155 RepID=UPI002B41594E|nr:excinuclease ABC subunit UvrA [Phytoplasma sp.]WRH06689.1 MAG: excinuclease ABC subunit UvrA [Phytoplasma sp.]
MNNNQIIKIRGARVNNLKNINLEIPKSKLIVVTGISGSGKSSLVFDTLYQEGKRKYIESLDSYSRHFLGNFEKPDVDKIEGLCPAISIPKKIISNNPRVTVGTMTEIYDYLRLLYKNISVPHHPVTNQIIQNQTLEEITNKILKLKPNIKIFILAPVFKKQKDQNPNILQTLIKEGFNRFIINNQILSLDNEVSLLKENQYHDIYTIIDRFELNDNNQERLYNSLELAFSLIPEKVCIFQEEKIFEFNRNLSKDNKDIFIPKKEMRLFSFNNALGFCENCQGLGTKKKIDLDLIICYHKSINNGGIIPYFKYKQLYNQIHDLKTFCQHHNIDMDIPLQQLSPETLHILLYGQTGNKLKTVLLKPTNMGVIQILEHYYNEENDKNNINYFIDIFMSQQKCDSCSGARLNKRALMFKIKNHNIYQLTELSIEDLLNFCQNLELKNEEKKISDSILEEITNKLVFLKNIGLGYLTLARYGKTLSGGETQRIRLTNQINAKLSGILYTLDEPSIGLHPKDNENLINSLKTIRDLDNTLLVIENDPATILSADYVIEIGPLAGEKGGELISCGSPKEIMKNKNSLTGQYLTRDKEIDVPQKRNSINLKKVIHIKNASENNLKNINIDLPLEIFIVITGVSGSGKSTLLNQIVKSNCKTKNVLEKNISLNKYNNINKIIKITTNPIGKKTKSNITTYTKILDRIQNLFASTIEAKIKGYTENNFSLNNPKGRCQYCSGEGIKKIDMYFLPNVLIKCQKCNGQKFNKEILKIKYKNKNISEILNMTVQEAFVFFDNLSFIKKHFQILKEIGLDYIRLGQSFATMSDGELQRIKLSIELMKQNAPNTIYILDEPTISLHSEDVKKLIQIIHRIVQQKSTVIMIEHNLDIIKNADYVIDLGPQGGQKGGYIIAKGTPEEISQNPKSYTGKYLKKILNLK